jgi:hypothetical protein
MSTPERYITPAADLPLQFGDVFSGDWLHDAMINQEAVALAAFDARGGRRAYTPLSPGTKRRTDLVLARGGPCRAVLVSDDCEIETWLVRKGGGGRLLFAALEGWPTGIDEQEQVAGSTSFRRHPLLPADGFEGGVVEFFRLFAVSGKSLLDSHGRMLSLTDLARAELEQRWAAYATRRGPMAAERNGSKLAYVLEAGDDAAKWEQLMKGSATPAAPHVDAGARLATALAQAWRVEGEIAGRFADAYEDKRNGDDDVPVLQEELRALSRMAADAADALDL